MRSRIRRAEAGHYFTSVFLILIIAVLMVVFVAGNSWATRFYPGGYQRCINTSGGRGDFHSVKYACTKATEKAQNACATWLGPTGNSATSIIRLNAASLNSIVYISYWGMCTDKSDRTNGLAVVGDNDSIGDGSAYWFTRSKTWGSPSSRVTPLNVALFVQGATRTGNTYYRRVAMARGHSDAGSFDYDFAYIYITVGDEEPVVIPDDEICKSWYPNYSSSYSSTSGKTWVETKIRNAASRFVGTEMGNWNDELIYAMPTDVIHWHTCYYPGVQKTYDTDVSDINGNRVDGRTGNDGTYDKLPSDTCLDSNPVVGFKELAKASLEYGHHEWQNQFETSGAAGGWGPKEFNTGQYEWNSEMQRRDTKGISMSNVGGTYTQTGKTGIPTKVSITSVTSSQDVIKTRPASCLTDEQKLLYAALGLTDPMECTEYYTACTNKFVDSSGNGVTAKYANVDYSTNSDSETVAVPYNFINTISVELSGTVYSGEYSLEVSKVTAKVNAKGNAVTQATYATVVPEIKTKLYAYVSDSNDSDEGGFIGTESDGCEIIGDSAKQCVSLNDETPDDVKNYFSKTSNVSLSSGGSERISDYEKTYGAFDASAGDYICVSAAIWPASSGVDTSLDGSGDNMWYISAPTCKIIGKRPTFQVWGGSMYSVKDVDGLVMKKENVYNYYRNNMSRFNIGSAGATYLGPWVEESLVIKDGITTTISSGAGTGNNSSSKSKVGNTKGLCDTERSALTFANYATFSGGPCHGANAAGGQSGIGSGLTTNTQREELIRYWLGDNAGGSGVAVNSTGDKTYALNTASSIPGDITTATGVKLKYIKADAGNTSIKGNIPSATTYLIRSEGTVTITGNIKYNGTYTNLRNIPKLVIYAKNVNIQCNVREVDAIIITKTGGTVNTCSNAGDTCNPNIATGVSNDCSSATRSRQLKVFGIVITDKIILGRTYGSAAWDRTEYPDTYTDGEAAEVFDYDSTMLMWSEFMAGSAETDTLQTVYQHELAPRY